MVGKSFLKKKKKNTKKSDTAFGKEGGKRKRRDIRGEIVVP